MKLRTIIISLLVIILLVGAGWAYWHFLMGPSTVPVTVTPGTNPTFKPISRPTSSTTPSRTGNTIDLGGTDNGNTPKNNPISTLRLLSDTPVGGYGVITTGATTTVRWVDRGRGNIYEATDVSPTITTLSNTIVPKIVTSIWNKNLTAFIGSLFQESAEVLSTIYAQLTPRASTTQSVAPYELRGKNIAGKMVGYAVSPDKTRVFMYMNESGMGTGYIASFDGKNMTKIFSNPLIQVSVDWPSDTTVTVTTKGSAAFNGYMYFVNPKSGVWTKVLGPIRGLGAVASHDAKNILYSMTGENNDVSTYIYNITKGTTQDAVIRTMAEKCAWGNLIKTVVYCGVPSPGVSGTYPDDWYRGTLATTDKIWQFNTVNNSVHLISSPIDSSDRSLNTFNVTLSDKDTYLLFMNKNDLSLWSLDLVKTR